MDINARKLLIPLTQGILLISYRASLHLSGLSCSLAGMGDVI
jgi:hypothetical protein